MIRIDRGKAPKELAQIRTDELRRVREELRRGKALELGGRYNRKSVREALAKAQQRRCAYCEKSVAQKGYPIDHYRPKGRAVRGKGLPADGGYWWLTWTWTNLWLTCPSCNSTKLDTFPLDPRSTPLARSRLPPGKEIPMLLDPASEDPRDTIRFFLVAGDWRPVPRNWRVRGAVTIRTLGLDDGERIEDYTRHVEKHVEPYLRKVEAAVATDDQVKVTEAWDELVRFVLYPQAVFISLSHDVIEQRLPVAVRTRFGLVLPPL